MYRMYFTTEEYVPPAPAVEENPDGTVKKKRRSKKDVPTLLEFISIDEGGGKLIKVPESESVKYLEDHYGVANVIADQVIKKVRQYKTIQVRIVARKGKESSEASCYSNDGDTRLLHTFSIPAHKI